MNMNLSQVCLCMHICLSLLVLAFRAISMGINALWGGCRASVVVALLLKFQGWLFQSISTIYARIIINKE